MSLLYIIVMGTKPDVLLLLGMLMLGMALGALLTHIRHKALTARIVQEFEAKCRAQTGMPQETPKNGSASSDVRFI